MTYEQLKSPSIFIGKQGNGIISFGSGQPDLPPPKEAIENFHQTNSARITVSITATCDNILS